MINILSVNTMGERARYTAMRFNSGQRGPIRSERDKWNERESFSPSDDFI